MSSAQGREPLFKGPSVETATRWSPASVERWGGRGSGLTRFADRVVILNYGRVAVDLDAKGWRSLLNLSLVQVAQKVQRPDPIFLSLIRKERGHPW